MYINYPISDFLANLYIPYKIPVKNPAATIDIKILSKPIFVKKNLNIF